ncbi:MAG: hypothetical protein EOM25_06645 [Deltaproteobacteria bacterium]|nr:hypothetical protein [Deltaproteobacteria bacterium]
MADVTAFPGRGCRFYIQGRCLYEEVLNPGYAQVWRCRVLVELERRFDDLLDRAESFHLDAAVTGRIWAGRQSEAEALFKSCPDFGLEGGDSCGHLVLGMICVLRLPSCLGACRRFSPGAVDVSW